MVSCLCFGSGSARKLNDNSETKPRRDKSPSSVKSARRLSDSETEEALKTQAQVFSYRQLATATNNFRTESLIGQGGFGTVYKGRLDTGQKIAVKMLEPSGEQGDKEFLVEVLMLTVLKHENLVHLFGYCAEGDQRGLVYEYLPLGALDDHLHDLSDDQEALDWITRMKIATGAAKGLEYLHNEAEPNVIYRDLKTSNILLDHGYKPKLSDFGFAKFGPTGDMSHVSTRVMGTEGYCAPEYASTGKVTLKSDIYSFGVVLLELITGRKAFMPSYECNGQKSRYLVHWVQRMYLEGQIKQIVDPMLSAKGGYSESILMKTLDVAFMCLNSEASTRPDISEVVRALDYIAGYTSRKQKKKRSSRPGRGRDTEEAGPSSSPKETTRMLDINEEEAEEEDELERQRAVAEAIAWAMGSNKSGKQSTVPPSTPSPSKSVED